jgi:hypothetical protein
MIPGVALHEAALEITDDVNMRVAISLRLALVKVEAGPIGAGGVRWNVYRTDEAVVGFQPFVQTLTVPAGTKALELRVQPWVVRRGYFFGLVGTRKFIPGPTTFRVSVEGLAQ